MLPYDPQGDDAMFLLNLKQHPYISKSKHFALTKLGMPSSFIATLVMISASLLLARRGLTLIGAQAPTVL